MSPDTEDSSSDLSIYNSTAGSPNQSAELETAWPVIPAYLEPPPASIPLNSPNEERIRMEQEISKSFCNKRFIKHNKWARLEEIETIFLVDDFLTEYQFSNFFVPISDKAKEKVMHYKKGVRPIPHSVAFDLTNISMINTVTLPEELLSLLTVIIRIRVRSSPIKVVAILGKTDLQFEQEGQRYDSINIFKAVHHFLMLCRKVLRSEIPFMIYMGTGVNDPNAPWAKESERLHFQLRQAVQYPQMIVHDLDEGLGTDDYMPQPNIRWRDRTVQNRIEAISHYVSGEHPGIGPIWYHSRPSLSDPSTMEEYPAFETAYLQTNSFPTPEPMTTQDTPTTSQGNTRHPRAAGEGRRGPIHGRRRFRGRGSRGTRQ